MEKGTKPPTPGAMTEIGKGPISLPIWVAHCGVARALRLFNKRGARFIVVLVLPAELDARTYIFAAKVFLEALAIDKHSYERDERVQSLETDRDVMSFEGRIISGGCNERTIIFVEDEKIITDTMRVTADLFVHLQPPTGEHFRAASSRIYGWKPSDADVDFLASQSSDLLQAAFRGGRSFAEAMRKLRQLQTLETGVVGCDGAKKKGGPILSELRGYGEAAEWGHELAVDIADWRAGKLDWKHVDRGVLIAGPPGTGKTMFAHALARTCDVPIVSTSSGKWQEAGYLNSMLKAMSKEFERANEKSPAILFIDEIDSIGSRGHEEDQNSDYTRQVISRFLNLLDEQAEREGVVIVGACNYPEFLDPAIKRSGRLDRQFNISPPDDETRLQIFAYHAGFHLEGEELYDFARRSDGLTGADIERLVRDARRGARRSSSELQASDVLQRLPGIVTLSADFIRGCAVHEIGHVIVALQMPHVEFGAVMIRGESLHNGMREAIGGAVMSVDETARRTKQYYLDLIAIDLAGIAAEAEILGDYTDGAGGDERADLNRATQRAALIEAVYGMGGRLTSHPSRKEDELRKLRTVDLRLDGAIQKLLQEQFGRARQIIKANRATVDELVERLVVEQFISAEDVKVIVENRRKKTSGTRQGHEKKQMRRR